MRKILFTVLGLMLLASISVLSQPQADKAQEILKQVRAALGGEAKLASITNFSALGASRNVSQGQDRSGEIKLEMMFPDKFMKTTTTQFSGIEVGMLIGMNGTQTWRDS